MSSGAEPVYPPRRVVVKVDPHGLPLSVDGVAVELVRERWWVEDRWWTAQPLDRRYFELVLVDGRDATVFRSEDGKRWYRQRA